jgi:hypothetical protein
MLNAAKVYLGQNEKFASVLAKEEAALETGSAAQVEAATPDSVSRTSSLGFDGSLLSAMMAGSLGTVGVDSSSMSGASGMLAFILLMLLMNNENGSALIDVADLPPLPGGAERLQDISEEELYDYANESLGPAVNIAMRRLGDPYSQAMAGQDDYTDCSYLTRWVYRQLGVELPRTAAAQGKYIKDNDLTVAKEELQPGDLIFYSLKENGRFMDISHVGIYAGNGKMVDASSGQGEVVYRDMFEQGLLFYGRPI